MNEEINLVQREIPLIPMRVASVFANKEKEDFDDGDTSVLEKIKPVSNLKINKKIERKIVIIFLSNGLNICFGCSKEPSQ